MTWQSVTADCSTAQALHAFELALSLEKLNYQKLWHLDDVATKAEDYEMASYVEEMLHNQVADLCIRVNTSCAQLCLLLLPWSRGSMRRRSS